MFDHWVSLIENKLSRWGVAIIKMLPNMILALIVMTLFIFIARIVRKLSQKLIHRLSKSESISSLSAGVLYLAVIVLGIMFSLNILRLEQAVTSLLAGVGIIGLALGFAFQDLTSNFISGAFIAFRRPFDVGHIVETNGFIGEVEDIQLRATKMRTFAGLHVIIPNKDIFQKPIINYSLTRERRVELEFQVPNSVDLPYLEKLLRDAMESEQDEQEIRKVNIFFLSIEDPKIKVYISFWTLNKEPTEFMEARHRAILLVYETLSAHGIYTVQFPKPEKKEAAIHP